MLMKMIKYAQKLGLDPDELMDLTVLDAILKIEETKNLWREVKQIG